MSKIRNCWLIVILFCFSFFVIASAVLAAESYSIEESTVSHKRLIVGAALKKYKPPKRKQCDINVPAQYATIQTAIDAAVNGDTVCVGKGTYNENVSINKSIQLSGRGASKTIINGQITNEVPGNYTILLDKNNITVEGFYIKGMGDDRGDTTIGTTDGSRSGTKIRYNQIVAGNGELAVRLDGYQTNNLFQNNVFEGNESPQVVWVGDGENVDFLNNTFIGTVPTSSPYFGDILVDDASSSMIKQNVFNVTGIIRSIVMASWPSVINENNLNSDSTGKIYNYPAGGVLNAENNWWGDLDPSDNIQGDVDFTPFVLSPFPEN